MTGAETRPEYRETVIAPPLLSLGANFGNIFWAERFGEGPMLGEAWLLNSLTVVVQQLVWTLGYAGDPPRLDLFVRVGSSPVNAGQGAGAAIVTDAIARFTLRDGATVAIAPPFQLDEVFATPFYVPVPARLSALVAEAPGAPGANSFNLQFQLIARYQRAE